MGDNQSAGYNNASSLSNTVVKDLKSQYGKGPQVFDENLYTGLSDQTRGQINTGMGQVAANQSGFLSDVAGGGWLGGNQNPYFEANLAQSKDNAFRDVNALFTGSGRFGSGSHVAKATDTLGNMENTARMQNFEDEYARAVQAQGLLGANTAAGLGYSGMLDADAQAQQMGEFDQFTRKTQAPFQHASNTLGLLTASQGAPGLQYQKPVWETLLGAGATVAGTALGAYAGG
jgi:hypothetical protein